MAIYTYIMIAVKKIIYFSIIVLTFAFQSCSNHSTEAQRIIAKADSCNKADNSLMALQYYIKALIAAKNESDDYLAMRSAGNISILYNGFGNVGGSLQYNKIGYDLSIKLNDAKAISSFLSNYVTYYCNANDSVNARKYYKLLTQMTPPKDWKRHKYFCLYEHARIMKCVGNYPEAIRIHKEALAYAQKNKLNDTFKLFQNSEIGNIMVLQHRYTEAVNVGKACLAQALRLKDKELTLNAYKMLADAYVGQNDKDSAYEYLEKYYKQSAGVYNMQKFFVLQNDLYKFETEQHQHKINSLTLGISVVAALSIILIFLLLVIVGKNKALRKAQTIVVNNDKEIIKLEQQKHNSETSEPQEPSKSLYSIPIDQKQQLLIEITHVFENLSIISDVDFSIVKMAELVESNVKYVSTVINEKYGKSFKNVLNEYRVKEACKMLTDQNYEHYTIKTIYESVGYRNAASFIRAFKNIKGMTPSIYQIISRENK